MGITTSASFSTKASERSGILPRFRSNAVILALARFSIEPAYGRKSSVNSPAKT